MLWPVGFLVQCWSVRFMDTSIRLHEENHFLVLLTCPSVFRIVTLLFGAYVPALYFHKLKCFVTYDDVTNLYFCWKCLSFSVSIKFEYLISGEIRNPRYVSKKPVVWEWYFTSLYFRYHQYILIKKVCYSWFLCIFWNEPVSEKVFMLLKIQVNTYQKLQNRTWIYVLN